MPRYRPSDPHKRAKRQGPECRDTLPACESLPELAEMHGNKAMSHTKGIREVWTRLRKLVSQEYRTAARRRRRHPTSQRYELLRSSTDSQNQILS